MVEIPMRRRIGQRRKDREWLLVIVAFIVASCGGAAATPVPSATIAPPTVTTVAAPPTSAATATSAAATATDTTALVPATATGRTAPAPATTTATTAAASPAVGRPAAFEPCSAVSLVSSLDPPAPTAAASPGAVTAPPRAATGAPVPTPTPRPAPPVDRVGFPEGYTDAFKLLFVIDRPDNKQVRVVCGNEVAASARLGQPFPYGSVLIMETYRAKQDAAGNAVKGPNGRYIREALTAIFVMRKEPGLGLEYGQDRSGEWEYVGYRPDKSYQSAPQNTNACASCHLRQAGEGQDFVFRTSLFFEGERALVSPAVADGEVNVFIYAFLPAELTVKAGTAVKWINNDEAEHTVVAADNLLFKSDPLRTKPVSPGESFSHTFTEPGTFEYFCSIHPQMKAKVNVVR